MIHLEKETHDYGYYTWCDDMVPWDNSAPQHLASGHPCDVTCGDCLYTAMDFYTEVKKRFEELADADA